MFSQILFILLPLVFIIHDLEEIIIRKYWMNRHAYEVIGRIPKAAPIVNHLKEQSTFHFCIIVFEEFLLLLFGVILFIYGIHLPLAALTWGFSLHLLWHVGQTIILRRYVPGVVTSLLFLPYIGICIRDLLLHYSILQNIGLTIVGVIIVVTNLLLMHRCLR